MKLKVTFLLIAVSGLGLGGFAQKNSRSTLTEPTIARPKLVIGIVVDQMRWDYLYRFFPYFQTNGGFRRLIEGGMNCDNTMIPYLPTVTACGHTCIYTGSVPAIHGIAANSWFDEQEHKNVYCTDDDSVHTVGSNTEEVGKMSPRRLWTTTIGDELRLSNNFRSKVFAISIKDRASILPGGHSANEAFWYDGKTGKFVTSSYYTEHLPAWVDAFNQRDLPDSFYNLNWKKLLPNAIYKENTDQPGNAYSSKPLGKEEDKLPYNLSRLVGKDYGKISSTPYGNDLLVSLAKDLIRNEKLGKGSETDMLAISFSSPDYIGHAWGPNSEELMDAYLRLDNSIADLLNYLDKYVGKGNYTLFLSADHGGAHMPEFLAKHGIPGGRRTDESLTREINTGLEAKFHKTGIVREIIEGDLYFNNKELEGLDKEEVKKAVIAISEQDPDILRVVDKENIASATLNSRIKTMVTNGYIPGRTGQMQILLKAGYLFNGPTGSNHGVWYPYDAHIPLIFYGWGIKKGKLNRETHMTDIAATLAALLHIQEPSGCVGEPIEEAIE